MSSLEETAVSIRGLHVQDQVSGERERGGGGKEGRRVNVKSPQDEGDTGGRKLPQCHQHPHATEEGQLTQPTHTHRRPIY